MLWIRIGFNADPAFYLNADPDTDTDPGSQTNADPGGWIRILVRLLTHLS